MYRLYTTNEQNKETNVFESSDKKETNKELKKMIKEGLIEKRGYDYFYTNDRSIELRKNY